jgi:hypothetical protein
MSLIRQVWGNYILDLATSDSFNQGRDVNAVITGLVCRSGRNSSAGGLPWARAIGTVQKSS